MKFSVFYHTILQHDDPPIETEQALQIVMEQSKWIKESGLAARAERFVVGVNGDDFDKGMLSEVLPEQAHIVPFGVKAFGEFMTLLELWEHAKKHPHELVCYFHTKGVTQPKNNTFIAWRKCMGNVVILHWRDCVQALESGKYDTAGAHLCRPLSHNLCPYFWGGNFWWCKTDYISTLPSPTKIVNTRYDAEVWLTRSRHPKACDFAKHWPGAHCLSSLKL